MKVSFRQFRDTLESELANQPASLPDWQQWAVSNLLACVGKKFVGNKSAKADSRALEKFLAANDLCGRWEYKVERLEDEYLLGELRNELYRFWYLTGDSSLVEDAMQLFALGRTGPGKSIGAVGTDYYAKLFSSKLTCTSDSLYALYKRGCSKHRLWDHAEKARVSDCGSYSIVPGNRLAFVPKTNEVSRTICVEPALNLFFQFGLGHVLTARLHQVYGIDLARQPDLQRELAYLGSITGSVATLDLSSASDTISLGMLRSILPREWVMWMELFRSPHVTLPDGSTRELFMVSSMGNAFTFPLETIIFRAIISAAARVSGLIVDPGLIGVFGDDMIYPTVLHRKVTRLLSLLGFVINADKTFVEGPFRESCGHDYFGGHDVRGVYIKTLETVQDRYVAINQLNAWSAKVGIPLTETVALLADTVPRHYVPMHENLEAGILVDSHILKRMRRDGNGSLLYLAYRPVPLRQVIRQSETGLRITGAMRRERYYNPFGLVLTFLHGYIRRNVISLRQDEVSYRLHRCVTPFWDYMPAESALGQLLKPWVTDDVVRRWKYAVYLGLTK